MALECLADDDFLLVATGKLADGDTLPGVLTCMVSMISCTICAPCLSSMKKRFLLSVGSSGSRELS